MSATDHFRSVSMMIEDLRSEDPEARLSSMRGLHCIAQTLGPERVRGELIPYLMDYLDDDDEVLKTLASSLGTMLAEVGGPTHVDTLLNALETLCTLDEVSVRDEAVSSLNNLAKTLFSSETLSGPQQQYLALLTRLSKSSEPRARCSACYIIAGAYEAASAATKKELKMKFVQLCQDEEVMVRRAACIALGNSLATVLGTSCSEIMSPFSTMCKDPSDSTRLQAIPAAVAMLPFLKDSALSQVVALMKGLSSDSSWRVRYMFADRFGGYCKALPKKEVGRVAPTIFKSLCMDQEAEIRASVVFSLPVVLECLAEGETSAKKDVLVVACKLAADDNVHVRSTLASVLLKSAIFTPKEVAVALIVPTANTQLEDPSADVRLALLGGFGDISKGEGHEVATSIAPKILPIVTSTLNKDPKWRVRETVVRQAPLILGFLGQEGTQLVGVCVEALRDRVATIRAAAAEGCAKLVEMNGTQWAKATLMPKLYELTKSGPYLPRLTFLQVVQKLIAVVPANTVKEDYLSHVIDLCADPVPNVRLNAAKTIALARAKERLSPAEADALLARFSSDKDPDCREAGSPSFKVG